MANNITNILGEPQQSNPYELYLMDKMDQYTKALSKESVTGKDRWGKTTYKGMENVGKGTDWYTDHSMPDKDLIAPTLGKENVVIRMGVNSNPMDATNIGEKSRIKMTGGSRLYNWAVEKVIIQDNLKEKVESGNLYWLLNNTETVANPKEGKLGLRGSFAIVGKTEDIAESATEKLWNYKDKEKWIDYLFCKGYSDENPNLNRIKQALRKGDWKRFDKIVKAEFLTEINERAAESPSFKGNYTGQITRNDMTTNLTDRYVNNQPITILGGAIYQDIGSRQDLANRSWDYNMKRKEERTAKLMKKRSKTMFPNSDNITINKIGGDKEDRATPYDLFLSQESDRFMKLFGKQTGTDSYHMPIFSGLKNAGRGNPWYISEKMVDNDLISNVIGNERAVLQMGPNSNPISIMRVGDKERIQFEGGGGEQTLQLGVESLSH